MILVGKTFWRFLTLAALSAVPFGPALAGEMVLEWDPVSNTDLAGYRIYYGVSQNETELKVVDIPITTSSTLTGLLDCSYYYVGVKARDKSGAVSTDLSNIIEGYARPRITAIDPPKVAHEQKTTLFIHGSGFAPGASPDFGKGIQVKSVNVDHCNRMTVNVQVLKSAPLGQSDVEVVNQDGSFGTKVQALEVLSEPEEEEETELTVESVSPDGTNGSVDPDTAIQVTFSRAVDPSSVGPKTFKVRGSGKVSLAPGSPRLDPTGRMVTLETAAPLQAGGSYSLTIKGGKKGVQTSDGALLAATYQGPVFRTNGLFAEILFGSSDDDPGKKLPPSGQVPADSVILLKFTEPIDPASVTAKSVKLKGKGKVTLEGGGPVLQPDGVTVSLEPTEPLPAGTIFQVAVKGGKKGVRSDRGVTMADKKLLLTFSTPVGTVNSLGIAE
jgi:hypothetical protein